MAHVALSELIHRAFFSFLFFCIYFNTKISFLNKLIFVFKSWQKKQNINNNAFKLLDVIYYNSILIVSLYRNLFDV